MITVSNRCQVPEVEGHPLLHAHHWLIDGQQGPVSPAFCKLCGCHREFSNGFVRRGFVLWAGRSKRESPQAIQSRDKEVTVVSN
jgi:hypothetical protein